MPRSILHRLLFWVSLSLIALVAGCGARTAAPVTYGTVAVATSDKVNQLLLFCERMQRAGDLAVAAGLCRRAYHLAPDDQRALVALGAIMLELGKPEDAVVAYRQALAIDRSGIEALIGLGKAYLARKQFAEAERQFQLAVRAQETDYRGFNGLGVLHDLRGDHTTAQSFYQTGLGLAPGNASLRSNLGLSLSLTGRHAQAIAILGDLTNDYQSDATNRQNLALAHGMAGDLPTAERVARIDLDAAAVAQNLKYYSAIEARRRPRKAASPAPAPPPAADNSAIASGTAAGANLPADAVEVASLAEQLGLPPVDAHPDAMTPDRTPAEKAAAAPATAGALPALSQAAAAADHRPASSVAARYRLQLGSFRRRASADSELSRQRKLLAGLIGAGSALAVGRADLGPEKGVWYRLTLAVAGDRRQANAVCSTVRGRGLDCFVRASSKPKIPVRAYRAEPVGVLASPPGSEPAFAVQLGAYWHAPNLAPEWRRFQDLAPSLLGEQTMLVRHSLIDGRRLFTLNTQSQPDEKAARALCQSLRSTGLDCVVAKVT